MRLQVDEAAFDDMAAAASIQSFLAFQGMIGTEMWGETLEEPESPSYQQGRDAFYRMFGEDADVTAVARLFEEGKNLEEIKAAMPRKKSAEPTSPAPLLPVGKKQLALTAQFNAARRVGTPIVAIKTNDPAATIQTIVGALKECPLLVYDVATGLRPMNESAKIEFDRLTGGDQDNALNLFYILTQARANLGKNSIIFLHNPHRLVGENGVHGSEATIVQAMWNLRDEFKKNYRQLVFLVPDIVLPAELRNDVLVLDEPLPDDEQLAGLVRGVYVGAGLPEPKHEDVTLAVSATAGLAAFPAEQALAMSLTRDGMDFPALWDRKRQMIEQTPGLSVWRGGERFADIAGVSNIKNFISRLARGPEAPNLVLNIEEIEKIFSNADGDLSGVKGDFLGTLLTWMQDNNALGIIAMGVMGAAKSMIAKAAGTELGGFTINMDTGAMKGSLVGESEQRFRQALKVVNATARGRVLVYATCNRIATLPPELRRRFTLGTFFFDLPTAEERDALWALYTGKYKLAPERTGVDDEGWTGAEIRQCCDVAWRLRCDLAEASGFVTPVFRTSREAITAMRDAANGRFISASYPGIYRHEPASNSTALAVPSSGQRAIELD